MTTPTRIAFTTEHPIPPIVTAYWEAQGEVIRASAPPAQTVPTAAPALAVVPPKPAVLPTTTRTEPTVTTTSPSEMQKTLDTLAEAKALLARCRAEDAQREAERVAASAGTRTPSALDGIASTILTAMADEDAEQAAVAARAHQVRASAAGRRPGGYEAQASTRDPSSLRAVEAAHGPAPTPFPTGDLPVMTASGIDPSVVAKVPWQARWAVTNAPTIAAAAELVNRYGGPDGEDAYAFDAGLTPALATHAQAYEQEFSRHMSGFGARPGPNL